MTTRRGRNTTSSNKKSLFEQFTALKELPQFFKLVWDTNKLIFTLNIILRIIKAAVPVTVLYVGKEIIDEVIHIIEFPNADTQYLWTMVALEFGLAILSDILNRGINLLDSLLGDLFANKSSVLLIEHAAKLDLYKFEDAAFYDKLEMARRQTIGRTLLMSQSLSQAQDLISLVFLGSGLLLYNPWLILLLFIAVLPSFLGESYFNQRNYSLTRSWTPERRELDYIRYIGASDETAKEVKTFNLSNFLASRFKELSDKYYHANKKIAIKRASWGVLLSAIGTFAYYGAYVFIIIQATAALISVGTLTFLAGSFRQMRNMLQGIMNRFSKIADGAMYLKDFFEFLNLQPQIQDKPNAKPLPQPIKEGFEFKNVSFKYPNSENYAIKNLSFKLYIGEKLALVGENGAGKTTLVKLLARLYEPTEGSILLDGVDLKEYQLDDLRNNIGIIFQDFIRFQMQANENIAIGDIVEKENEELIQDSAEKSLASDVIENLPAKYKQVLGKRFNNGVELSGGQWQKVALARAYMKDAQLMILDEPTAALDARAEHEVFLRFAELIEGKMAVLISHRFSTVRMADRILFLENGQLLELGSHDELIALNGKYAELFNLQAAGYV